MPRKLTVVYRKESQWLIDYIQDIVDTKKKLGFNTSFSYELFRLAKKGLVDSKEGEEIDKLVLSKRKPK